MPEEPTREQRIDEAESWCKQVRESRQAMLRALDRYKEAVEGRDGLKAIVNRDGGKSHVSAGDDAVMALIESANDRLDKYVQSLHQFEGMLDEFDAALDRMENQSYARILSLRYVSGWEWADITREVPYTYNHICTYAREAAMLDLHDHMGRPSV